MNLLDMVRNYQELLDKKEALAAETKENNKAIEQAKEEIAQQMIDDDCPRISSGGYSFSLSDKIIYSKRSEAALAEAGLSFLDVLREEGMGHLIQETVNSRTLQSAMKDFVEENGELTEGLDSIISSYETYDITRRKEANRAAKKGK